MHSEDRRAKAGACSSVFQNTTTKRMTCFANEVFEVWKWKMLFSWVPQMQHRCATHFPREGAGLQVFDKKAPWQLLTTEGRRTKCWVICLQTCPTFHYFNNVVCLKCYLFWQWLFQEWLRIIYPPLYFFSFPTVTQSASVHMIASFLSCEQQVREHQLIIDAPEVMLLGKSICVNRWMFANHQMLYERIFNYSKRKVWRPIIEMHSGTWTLFISNCWCESSIHFCCVHNHVDGSAPSSSCLAPPTNTLRARIPLT